MITVAIGVLFAMASGQRSAVRRARRQHYWRAESLTPEQRRESAQGWKARMAKLTKEQRRELQSKGGTASQAAERQVLSRPADTARYLSG